jgi:hypothetical protein
MAQPPTLLAILYPLGKGTAPCPSDILLREDAVDEVGLSKKTFGGYTSCMRIRLFLAKSTSTSRSTWQALAGTAIDNIQTPVSLPQPKRDSIIR